MYKELLDLLSVGLIGIAAIFFMFRTYRKIRKNSCATLCNGCSTKGCATKSFTAAKVKTIKWQ
jgi:hypothetical protein